MLVSSTAITAIILYYALPTTAYYSSSATRPADPQFQSWYPDHNKELINMTLTTCKTNYFDYLDAYYSPRGSRNASYLRSTCYALEGCLLKALPMNWQANFNSANVILGLMPTLLASVGPSVAEISLLSAHRPLLSFLISMGAPAIWPTRLFVYINPAETLNEPRGALTIGKIRPWSATMMSLGQYLFAVGAMVNIITTSVGVGRKSILAWGCTTTLIPLLWSVLPCVIHVSSAISYLTARKMARRRDSDERSLQETVDSEAHRNADALKSRTMQAERSRRPWFSLLKHAWLGETTICANRPKAPHFLDSTKMPQFATLLAIVAGVTSFVHLTFGVMTFSSLQFISNRDALVQIILRYMSSSIVCRLLLIMEISGLRTKAEEDG